MGNFCRLSIRRAFLFSIFQVIMWPLFYIYAISESQKSVLKSWYLKLVRATLRVPQFLDWETLENVCGVEDFDTLVKRQISVKVFCIDARSYWYKHNKVEVNDDACEIYTPFELKNERQTNYDFRNDRKDYPFKYAKKVVQNQVFLNVNAELPFSEAPWRKDNKYFEKVDFEKVGFLARCYTEKLAEKRAQIIKESLYNKELKKLETREQENKKMSEYIENRREYWNFTPNALEQNTFFIC